MYWIPFCKKPIFLNTREKKPLLAENKSNSFQYIKNKSGGGGGGGGGPPPPPGPTGVDPEGLLSSSSCLKAD